jgi:hypothetical protein
MTNENYNGWSNYATWLINLHLENSEVVYSEVNELAEASIDSATEGRSDCESKEKAILYLSESIKDYIENHNPLSEDTGLYSDMIKSVIASANYYEIAESWLQDF